MIKYLLIVLGGIALMAEAAECPEFEAPKARLNWIAKDMLVSGVPMAILQVDSDQSPLSMIAHYKRVWAAGGGEVTEYPVAGWQAVATARGQCFYTFQVKPVGTGSTGLLSVSQANTGPLRKPERFPMPSGSQVVNDIEHRDGIKNGRTVFLRNGLTMESNAIYYRNNLPSQGWKISMERRINTKNGPGIVFDMKRDKNLAMLTISRSEGQTNVLFNYMDRP